MKIYTDYAWSTHQPVIRMTLDVFKPQIIVELGIGMYSTPLFIDYKPTESFYIDNDLEWIESVKKQCPTIDESKLIFHDLGKEIKIGTFLHQISQENRQKIEAWYKYLCSKLIMDFSYLSPRLLFVDNFVCCRTLAMNNLYKFFDVIIFHDCEPAGIPYYEYNQMDKTIKDRFAFYCFHTPQSWTGCLISKDLVYSESALYKAITDPIADYCKTNGLDVGTVLFTRKDMQWIQR